MLQYDVLKDHLNIKTANDKVQRAVLSWNIIVKKTPNTGNYQIQSQRT